MKKYIPVVEYKTFEDNIRKYNLSSVKLDIVYHVSDHRYWTAIVNHGTDNLFVTFHVNKTQIGDRFFDILSSGKTITDIYVEDIYDSISLLVSKQEELINE